MKLLIQQLQITKLIHVVNRHKSQPDSLNQPIEHSDNFLTAQKSRILIKMLASFQKHRQGRSSKAQGQEQAKNQKIELPTKEDFFNSKLNLTENHLPG